MVSSSSHRAITIPSCALDSSRPHAPAQQACLGKIEAACVHLLSPSNMDLHLDGASWVLQELRALLLATSFNAYRGLLIGAALMCQCTQRRRGPVLGQVRPTPCIQAFDVNSADCRPYPCRSKERTRQVARSGVARRLAESERFFFFCLMSRIAMAHHSRWSSVMSLTSRRATPCTSAVVLIAISRRLVEWR